MSRQAPAPPRRVAFIAPFGLRQKTTIWARTLPLAQHLAASGWQVAILIPPWDSPADAGKRWAEGGVEIINVALGGGLPAIVNRLLRANRQFAPHIMHIVKPRAYAGIAQWWLWQQPRRGVPLLLDIDDWEQAWAPINRYPALLARFLAWQEEWGIRHADGITAASHWLENRAQAYAPATPRLYLPNGVAAPADAPTGWTPPDSHTVLFFTRFVEVSPAWLARFWSSLYASTPTARLVIAGGPVQPGLDAPFRQAVAQTGSDAAAAVTWLGYVPGTALPGLYAAIRCAIFPAADVPLQQAKCSVRLATTLLQGIPVVASAVGEQAHYGADRAACLVPAMAPPEAFAAEVGKVLRNPQAQLDLGAAARRRLTQRYDWQQLAARLAAFYSERLSGF